MVTAYLVSYTTQDVIIWAFSACFATKINFFGTKSHWQGEMSRFITKVMNILFPERMAEAKVGRPLFWSAGPLPSGLPKC
jgi:hypothetical protein